MLMIADITLVGVLTSRPCVTVSQFVCVPKVLVSAAVLSPERAHPALDPADYESCKHPISTLRYFIDPNSTST